MTDRILVTAAAGNVGQHVVRSLRARGCDIAAADYDVDRARSLFDDDDIACVRLDFRDPSSWQTTCEGCTHMFLLRPPAIADVGETLNPFIDVATEAGVDHIVFLSVAGAGENKIVPHRKVEDHLRSRGDNHTNLRPGFFAQNLATAYRTEILENDRIYLPAGNAPVNWIDVRDIADVAALILSDPEPHRAQNYTLAGAGPIEWSEVCTSLNEAVGRPIRYDSASVPGYVINQARHGLGAGAIAVQTILHFLLRFGQGATEDDTLPTLLGRPPRTLHAYVEEHADIWRTS